MEEVTYLIEEGHQLEQAGSFQNLQTLVEVSSLLHQQGDHLQLHPWPGNTAGTNVVLHQGHLQTVGVPSTVIQQTGVVGVRPRLHVEDNIRSQVEDNVRIGSPVEDNVKRRGGGRRGQGGQAEFRACHVCGEKAGRHSYYGGQVCPSCRAFFRRSVQSGYNATYFCIKEGNCEINLKTRKNCQYCRYKKCEACGMKTTWVLTDEERKEKFEGRRGKRKKKTGPEYEACDDPPGVPDIKERISEDELVEVNQYVRDSGHWDISKVNDMDVSLIREIIRMVAFHHKMSDSGQKELNTVIIKRGRKFAYCVREFQDLSYHDRQQLLTANLPTMLELQICTTFNPELLWTEQLTPILGQEEVDKLDNKLRSLNVTGLDQLQLIYNQFFQRPCMETDRHTGRQMVDIGIWSQDEKEYMLVSLLLLFSPDTLDLAERRRVEDIQLKFATLLQKYLYYKHQSEPRLALSRFTSSLLLVTRCREFSNLTKRAQYLV